MPLCLLESATSTRYANILCAGTKLCTSHIDACGYSAAFQAACEVLQAECVRGRAACLHLRRRSLVLEASVVCLVSVAFCVQGDVVELLIITKDGIRTEHLDLKKD